MAITWTSAFGRACGVLLDAIVRWMALARINPNVLTFLGLVVPAVGIDDVVLGDVPQPEMEGHDRVLEIIAEPPAGFQQHLLHNVAGIDASSQGWIETQADHAAQRFAVDR